MPARSCRSCWPVTWKGNDEVSEMSDKDCIELAEFISAYGDGELEGDELARVESHLEGCDHCRERLEAYREMDAAASDGADAPAVSDTEWNGRKAALMAGIAPAASEDRPKNRVVSIAWRVAATFALGAAAAIILAVVFAGGTGEEDPTRHVAAGEPSEIISVEAGDDYSLAMDYFDDGVVVTFIAEAEE